MGQVAALSVRQVSSRCWQRQCCWHGPKPLLPQHCSPSWIPGGLAARSLSSMATSIRFSPAARSLFDEPLGIAVQGLGPRQQVTLRASLRDEAGELFEAHGRYQAADDGELDLARCPALPGGSFSGLEPMGLLWALQPRKPFWRLVKKDVQTPFRLQLEVLEGHGDPPGQLLAQAEHERLFLRDGVRRVPVREGRIRATLFLPPGEYWLWPSCCFSKRIMFSQCKLFYDLHKEEPMKAPILSSSYLLVPVTSLTIVPIHLAMQDKIADRGIIHLSQSLRPQMWRNTQQATASVPGGV